MIETRSGFKIVLPFHWMMNIDTSHGDLITAGIYPK